MMNVSASRFACSLGSRSMNTFTRTAFVHKLGQRTLTSFTRGNRRALPLAKHTPVLGATTTLSGLSTPFSIGRSIFIQTEETPNPESLKFFPGVQVLDPAYGQSMDFRSIGKAHNSPLAKQLLQTPGVVGIFLGPDFVTVTKEENIQWGTLKAHVFEELMDFFASGKETVTGTNEMDETAVQDDDDEIVALIKELLSERIRPMVQEDGGDILFRGFDEDTGIVMVEMAGSCSGCPSSTITLKSGVENMLMHYIPEVKAVHQVDVDDEEDGGSRKLQFDPSN